MLKHSVNFLAGFMLSLLCFAASAPAAPLNLSQVPLYLVGNVKPNIILSVDDSGSMDSEVLFQNNDGALWWHTGDKSFTGRDRNDASAPGVTNFNKDGNADDTWKKYVYLFPNGVAFGKRVYDDSTHAHYAIPPLPQFAYTRSPAYNAAYFNPAVSYKPWAGYGSTTFGNISPAAAKSDPTRGTDTFNLIIDRQSANGNETFKMYNGMTLPAGTFYRDWTDSNWKTAATDRAITTTRDVPIRYFPATFYLPSGTALPAGYGYSGPIAGGTGPAGEALDGYEIKPGNFSSTAAYDAAIQNFANWFSYYRKRHAATRGGIGESFKDMTNARLGSFAINNRITVTMRDMSVAADRDSFYSTVYNDYVGSSGTPNREALNHLGTQFMRSNAGAPITLACQQNYAIAFTDGYSNNTTTAGVGNADGTKGSPYADSASNTIADIAMHYYSNNLRPDLAAGKVRTPSGCSSASPDPRLDCNKNPHMVTFGVILGVPGEIFNVDMAATSDPYANPPTWPTTFANRHPSAIDDLWHATINGRGSMLNARTPAEIAAQLSAVVNNIEKRNSSAASVALNSGSITSDSHLYQAKFNTANWSGQLLAIPIKFTDGTLGATSWDAAVLLDAPVTDVRKIVTYKPSAAGAGSPGIPFRWPANPLLPAASELDPSQVTALNINPATGSPDVPTPLGKERLDYLRGKAVSGFRTRTSRLGDSVYSSPAFVGDPQARYSNWRAGDPETGTYSAFESSKAGRTPMVYVGANDGMLHAFDATSDPSPPGGSELFAYVPASVFKNLNQLTSPTYSHRSYVDGSPIVGDAFFGGQWHTVLLGGLRGGGQGIYALDITNPPAVTDTETGIAAKVLWEFTDGYDDASSSEVEGADLGYTYSDPNIVRMNNGKWAAVFGNGYNNTEGNTIAACTDSDAATLCTASITGNAVLYIVDIADGSLIAKLDTKEGSAQDPTGLSRPNGLATPAPIDANENYIVDYIYAGDLFGNMWKFDVTSPDKTLWKVAYGSAANPDPLFTACAGASCTSSNHQPITTRPQVGRHPTLPNGFLVFFGTGKYFESGDASPTAQTTQSFYGIWDKNATSLTAFDRGALVEQVILKEVSETFDGFSYDLRATTKKPITWTTKSGWYMDLVNKGVSPLDNKGEKQVTDSILRNDRIVFTTLIPSVDPCDFGGTGWLMELDAATGGQLDFPPFDLDQDKAFNQDDYVQQTITADFDGDGTVETRKVPPSGKRCKEGICAKPGVVAGTGNANNTEYKFSSGSTGNIERTVESVDPGFAGRTSWRELKQ